MHKSSGEFLFVHFICSNLHPSKICRNRCTCISSSCWQAESTSDANTGSGSITGTIFSTQPLTSCRPSSHLANLSCCCFFNLMIVSSNLSRVSTNRYNQPYIMFLRDDKNNATTNQKTLLTYFAASLLHRESNTR